jgi:triacylglycerol esterase/lipase EstA (alpha/beta hydrolase family)
MRRRLTLIATAAIAAACALTTVSGPAQAAAPLPVNWNWPSGFVGNMTNSAKAPAGANDYNCKGTAAKPPVILVHGTWEHQADNWTAMSPFLKNNGFCVFTFNYGGNPGDVFWGWGPIATSAGQLGSFIDSVLAKTGAPKVNLVGHSQGGMMPRYYIKFLGGSAKVDKLIGLAASNHGTTLSGLADLGKFLGLLPAIASIQPAAIDQTIGSSFMQQLDKCTNGPNADICAGDPVKYTMIETNGDQIVTPYTNAFLKGATNIEVNKVCPLELSEHLGMAYSQNVAQLTLKALDPTVTKNVCVLALPYLGG